MVHWQAIESALTGSGIPDSNGCHDEQEFWMECKSTQAWAVKFEPEQIGWIHRRTRAGGLVWIAVRRRHEGGPRIGDPVDELWLVQGCWVRELAGNGLKHMLETPWPTTFVFHDGPSKWEWPLVLKTLTRKRY